MAKSTTLLLSIALAGGFVAASFAEPEGNKIPALASRDFGWQTNVAEWQEPPPGMGRGPIHPDPAHPFISNAESGRLGVQPSLRLGDTKDPVLKEWAAKSMQVSNEEALAGKYDVPFAAQARCWPGGVPGQLLYPFEPFYFIQTPKEVWMMWQRDHMVRRIYLRDKHSANVKPDWFGESIGHYENGDTLVVDTIGLSTKNSYMDNYRTPHTEKMHVVERFTVAKDGNSLTAVVTVEDPGAYNAPLNMKQRWWKAKEPMDETICAENNNDAIFFHQKLFALPEAKTPDF